MDTAYPGAVTAEVWAQHADAGCTTWTAGIAPRWDAAFVENLPAVTYAAGNQVPLIQWDGHTGHPAEVPPRGDIHRIEVPEMGEMEMEIG